MDIVDLGEIIATRKLQIAGDPKREIKILIGKPREFADHPDYYCPYQIVGIGNEKIRYAGGVDAVQALQLAVKIIGVKLQTSKEAEKLRWLDQTDLGFPVFES